MQQITLDPTLLQNLKGKTAILTGAAGGIGLATTRLLLSNGANVVMADMPHAQAAAEKMIASLPDPSRAVFVSTDTVDWGQMTAVFRTAKERFGSVEVVVANAGVMESEMVLDVDGDRRVDENGDLEECGEFSKVVDVNVKGTMNTLRQSLFHMKDNPPCFPDGSRGSIVLIISTSGYFGATGVAGYITSKHAITGLLRGSQVAGEKYSIRINAVAPFMTPTAMVENFAHEWRARGFPVNRPETVAEIIATLAMDWNQRGACYLAAGPILREIEDSQKAFMGSWLGEDLTGLMATAGQFFKEQGGYPLPSLKAMKL